MVFSALNNSVKVVISFETFNKTNDKTDQPNKT